VDDGGKKSDVSRLRSDELRRAREVRGQGFAGQNVNSYSLSVNREKTKGIEQSAKGGKQRTDVRNQKSED